MFSFEEKGNLALWASNDIFVSNPILKSKKMTIFVFCNCQPDETIPNLIQWPKFYVELDVLTVGRHTVPFLPYFREQIELVIFPSWVCVRK